MKMSAICVLLCMPATALAQEPRVQLPTETQRKVADAASWATAFTTVALDTRASWDCLDRRRCFTTQGARLGVTYGVVYLVKKIVYRKRPCYPDCGIDNQFSSFYSAHTALAFQSVGGPRLMFTIPLSIGTGGLRVAAGKHWITDTLVGAGAGLITSRIR